MSRLCHVKMENAFGDVPLFTVLSPENADSAAGWGWTHVCVRSSLFKISRRLRKRLVKEGIFSVRVERLKGLEFCSPAWMFVCTELFTVGLFFQMIVCTLVRLSFLLFRADTWHNTVSTVASLCIDVISLSQTSTCTIAFNCFSHFERFGSVPLFAFSPFYQSLPELQRVPKVSFSVTTVD